MKRQIVKTSLAPYPHVEWGMGAESLVDRLGMGVKQKGTLARPCGSGTAHVKYTVSVETLAQ